MDQGSPTSVTCPTCGTSLTPDLPEGLCPRCLLGTDGEVLARDDGGARDVPGDAAESDDDPLPRIARYRIIRLLGAGGMGAVYEAEQRHPKRTVALKVIRPGLASRRLLRRFEYEAETLGRLQHPGIAQIYESGATDADGGAAGRPFFAMELVRGPGGGRAPTITEYARENRLSLRERLSLLAEAADAVHYAHQKGIIHRDLKPGNILVGEAGRPKIVDFGVARLTESDLAAATAVSMHTAAGQVIGTLPYMSPEQAAGDVSAVDVRSDVYALGVVGYELLSGKLPLELDSMLVHEAVRAIREDEPARLSSADRTLRGDVDTIVATALAKERDRRYQSAGEFAADIRRFLKDEPISARPAGTWYQLRKFARRNRVLVTGVAAVFIALLLGIVASGWQAVQASRAREEARQRLRDSYLAQARAVRMSGQAGRRFEGLDLIAKAAAIRNGLDLRNEAVACSALADFRPVDGWRGDAALAFDPAFRHYAVADSGGEVRVRGVTDHRDVLRIPRPQPDAAVLSVEFSPDGALIAVRYHDGLCMFHSMAGAAESGGAATEVPVATRLRHKVRVANVIHTSFAGNRTYAVCGGSQLWLCNLDTGEQRTVELHGECNKLSVQPNGRYFCFSRPTPGYYGDTVFVCDLGSGAVLATLPQPAFVYSFSWHPTADRIAVGTHPTARLWDWKEHRLAESLVGHKSAVTGIAYSPDGRFLATASWDGMARLWDAETGRPLAVGRSRGYEVQFAADGRHVAVTWTGGPVCELWEVARPRELRMLYGHLRIPGGIAPTGLHFSPDGSLLASAGTNEVHLYDPASGTHVGRLAAPDVESVLFHPGGKRLFVYGNSAWRCYPVSRAAGPGGELEVRVGPGRSPDPAELTELERPDRVTPHEVDPAPFVRGSAGAVGIIRATPDRRWAAAAVQREASGKPGWCVEVRDLKEDRVVLTTKVIASPGVRMPLPRFSPDGRWLSVATETDYEFFDTRTWAMRHRVEREMSAPAGHVEFTPDGAVAAVPYSSYIVRLIDTAAWQELATLEAPVQGFLSELRFSPDGRLLALGGEDWVVRLWDLRAVGATLARAGVGWSEPSFAPAPSAGEIPATGATRTVRFLVEDAEAARPMVRDRPAGFGVFGARPPLNGLPPRDPKATPLQIDLGPHYTMRLTERWPHLPEGARPEDDLPAVPRGLQTFGGVAFDCRGVLQLSGSVLMDEGEYRFPEKVTGVKVGMKCRRFHFLGGTRWPVPDGTTTGEVSIRYADGRVVPLTIVYGRDVRDGWSGDDGPVVTANVGWQGPAAESDPKRRLRLYHGAVPNPLPDVAVDSLAFTSKLTHSAPFLVAVTLEE